MQRGFTLIEVLVSVMIFSVVMVVALGALLSMSQSDQRAEALKSVINNLNFTIDSMTHTIRYGSSYHCGSTGDLSAPVPQDCAGSGQTYLALRDEAGVLTALCLYQGSLWREQTASGPLDATCGPGGSFSPLTSTYVTLSNLQFIVTGSCPQSTGAGCAPDNIQPKVTILLTGTVSISGVQSSTFTIETSVTQRVYDK